MLRDRRIVIVTALFLAQSVLIYAVSWKEVPGEVVPLRQFPRQLTTWRTVGEGILDQEVLDQLRPDDYLARSYAAPDGKEPLNLFIGYFQSLRLRARPHSPRRCLPGSGWLPHSFRQIVIPAAGAVAAFPANEYILEKGSDRILVLYWYQNPQRAVSRELWLKVYMLPDLFQYQRSDVALVRVIQPVAANGPTAAAFSRLVYASLSEHFSPSSEAH